MVFFSLLPYTTIFDAIPGLTKLRFLVRRWNRMRFLVSPRSRGECRVRLSVRCAVVDRRGDKGVYTDRRERPLGAVLGHLCTLLRHEPRRVERRPRPPWRAGGVPSLAPPPWSGKQALRERRRR